LSTHRQSPSITKSGLCKIAGFANASLDLRQTLFRDEISVRHINWNLIDRTARFEHDRRRVRVDQNVELGRRADIAQTDRSSQYNYFPILYIKSININVGVCDGGGD
jgi:hypothetical protein